ncbi:hypothetical protein E1A91_A08G115800v1 [Gossypium mustelinum]|uniref:Homeobox-leucine zipper protein n=1 Tax=Gossypium mustelinum TaxID=34275 RepID=A0A5D2Y7B1_GOSMU|nr:hypothetical protein E1A91_A08G115800v1 [Gossypium mustelinum]
METEYHPAVDEAIAGQAPQIPRNKKMNKLKKKRRFSDEQIRLLESIFESETKLEPRKKMQPARELGLQPRQVAIWFQNKRARWKSKQKEQDYNTLKANYDNLESRFESLKKEKQSLILLIQKLSQLLEEPRKGRKGLDGSSTDGGGGGGGSKYGENKWETEAEGQPSFQHKECLGLQTENERDDVRQTGQGGEEFLIMDEYRNDSPASPDKFYGLHSTGMFDHSYTNFQWLNFWT